MFNEDQTEWLAPSGNRAINIAYKNFGQSCVVTCSWDGPASAEDMHGLVAALSGQDCPVRFRQFAEDDHGLTEAELEQIALGLAMGKSLGLTDGQ